MSAQPNKSRFGLKLLVALIVIAGAVFFTISSLRPVARVAVVTRAAPRPAGPGLAINSVPGSVLVTAARIAQLTSEIGGRIQKNELEPGKIVKEGDVVVQIDTGDIDLEIEKIQIDLEAAKKKVAAGSAIKFEYDTALENLENAKRNFDRGSLSELDLARQKRTVEAIKLREVQEEVVNKQQIDSLENLLKVKQRQRTKMTITAPFDGVVSSVTARKDDQIGNSFPIATLITISRAVEAKISEENFASVQLNQRAIVRFLTYGDEKYEATVIKKLPTAEIGTQRYVAHLDVKIDPEKLLPDLTGEVSIIVAEREGNALVPRRSVFDGLVYVVNDGRVELRKVKLGYTSLNIAEVLEGVKVGEQVIVDEIEQFHSGERVRAELVK